MTKANKEIKGKPPVVWLKGTLDYFNAPFPHGQDNPRRNGFAIGAQIIGLYLAEMLLQYKLVTVQTGADMGWERMELRAW